MSPDAELADLYGRFDARLHAYARGILRDDQDARDAV